MLDYARPYDHTNMYDMYHPPTPTAPARLETFQVFKKGNASYIYGNYYNNFDVYAETEVDAGNVYHNLVAREYPREDWRYTKTVAEWTEDDTMTWIYECAAAHCFSESEVPIYNFKVSGVELRGMRRDEVIHRMSHPNVDPQASKRLGEIVYDKLQARLSEEARPTSVYRYGDLDPYQHQESAQTMLDLDSPEHKYRKYVEAEYKPMDMGFLPPHCESSDDAEDYRLSETASPECDGSDGSNVGDDEDKRKIIKRMPGRPKGSGRKITSKRPRSVSVPEFLRNLLLDPKHCPSIIKWENHAEGKFRFVKPDEVAKLWGQMKQNDNMTFEKFSRAMRYHYRQSVLVSVPSHRLVYQFGHKGPDFKTDNPNFVKVKLETEMAYS